MRVMRAVIVPSNKALRAQNNVRHNATFKRIWRSCIVARVDAGEYVWAFAYKIHTIRLLVMDSTGAVDIRVQVRVFFTPEVKKWHNFHRCNRFHLALHTTETTEAGPSRHPHR